VRLATMQHDRQACLAGQYELGLEQFLLTFAIGVVDEIVEADLADGYGFFPFQPRRKIVHVTVAVPVRVYRVQSERREETGLPLTQRRQRVPAIAVDGGYQHARDAGRAGAVNNSLAVCGEVRHIDMAMGIEQLHGAHSSVLLALAIRAILPIAMRMSHLYRRLPTLCLTGWMVVSGAAIPAHADDYLLQTDRSVVRIFVWRAGLLRAAGHNHVITSRQLQGRVIGVDGAAGTGEFTVVMPVASLEVDRADDRAAAGERFASEPGENARAATTRNMLGPQILDAARYPMVRVRGRRAGDALQVVIDLHGIRKELVIPVRLAVARGSLVVDGGFVVNQSDFGITPFRALGGALRVDDRVDIRFHVAATRIEQ
jgi:polyisoprenoid-binding protein YceI